ncbi:hypothetical protein [Cellulosilyticum sp. WCF-2]|uniref:hypothetical protein n=1 Tax=Cellulosilyticum sp. WCF-2 TaxID=2497860 RepID=UPI001681BAE1|nr:hypothetical protein [Cellulosilyticum sp. WCF-2]
MKHIITVNGKLIEEITLEERIRLDRKIIESAKKYYGLIIPFDEIEYKQNNDK